MKKYSCKKCLRGRTAYRSPSSFRYRQYLRVEKLKSAKHNPNKTI